MSFHKAENDYRTTVSRDFPSITDLSRFLWLQALVLTVLSCIAAPAGANVLFPHDYGNGEILNFTGGAPGKAYELRIAQPGGGIVKASEGHLDVSFLDHRRVKIAAQRVSPETYRAFYGPSGAGGSTQVLAAVYLAGTDTIVDSTLVINTTYDPSPHFQDARFTGNQLWATREEMIEGGTRTFSFSWRADHGGSKKWRAGQPRA